MRGREHERKRACSGGNRRGVTRGGKGATTLQKKREGKRERRKFGQLEVKTRDESVSKKNGSCKLLKKGLEKKGKK